MHERGRLSWILGGMVLLFASLLHGGMSPPARAAERTTPERVDPEKTAGSKEEKGDDASTTNKLTLVWTSGDPAVAHKMVFLYALHARKQGWFKEVRLIVWGPSAKLLAEDEGIQQAIQKVAKAGVILEACRACADSYGVSTKLAALGCDMRYMGAPLSDRLKTGWRVMTF